MPDAVSPRYRLRDIEEGDGDSVALFVFSGARIRTAAE